MKKSEIISISLGVVIFVITNLALNDIFSRSNIVVTAIVGGVSALFSFWWSYKLLPKFTLTRKVLFTLLCLAVVIFAAYLTNRNGADRKKLQLVGKWISPPNDEGASELIFEFKPSDSLIVIVDSQRVDLSYAIKRGDQILAIDESGDQKFKWSIKTLTAEELIIGDGDRTMELKRAD
jgi:hypothetical protein